jgi:transposase InsO family protein
LGTIQIERWHRLMKDQVLLENYYLPGDLKARLGEFIEYYNTQRYHESLNNLTPEDVYTGRGQTVLNRRMRIKQKTIAERRRPYYKQEAA